MDGNEPDIPYYKVVESTGPTNTRVYKVAVYFRDKRLASSTGHSIQQAEMNAAKKALEMSKDLFPQLDHQKRVIANSLKRQKVKRPRENSTERVSSEEPVTKLSDGESRLPKQYQKRINIISDASDISSSSLDESDENFESDSETETQIVKKREGSDVEESVEAKEKEVAVELPTEPISSPELAKPPDDVFSELSEGEFGEFED
jgi:ribonuclease-3